MTVSRRRRSAWQQKILFHGEFRTITGRGVDAAKTTRMTHRRRRAAISLVVLLAQLYQFAGKSELDQCHLPKSLHYSGEFSDPDGLLRTWQCARPQPTPHSTGRKQTWSTLQRICGYASLIGLTFLGAHTPKNVLIHCELVKLG